VFAGRINGSDLFFFLIALVQLMQPVRVLSEVIGRLHEGAAAADNVFSVLDAVPSVKSGPLPAPHQHTETIRFENVSFKYGNSSEQALNNVSFDIEPQNVVALVGPSGAGKTTIVDLLARFYDPTSGRIILEGHDMREYELTSLRKLFGIVTQDTILFHDTIFNNIAYGDRNATHAMVIEAARAANAHDFIMAMPDGYNTIVGDRGVRMSGGQRQRVAIARALVKNPPILIFDEATSALDTESEKLVQEAIERLLEHRTAIVIAHRLSTIQRADRIIVLDHGKIAESGKHHELVSSEGLYQRLYQLQFTESAPFYETEE
jgi:subfamily B ATP-binding cassette protein MsbA